MKFGVASSQTLWRDSQEIWLNSLTNCEQFHFYLNKTNILEHKCTTDIRTEQWRGQRTFKCAVIRSHLPEFNEL